jgi:signal transduction histidine kinase
VTLQRRLLFGFSLMVLPVLLVGAEAIRSNAFEHRALETLGARLARNRTYAEVENAMFHRTEVVWRYLTGLDSTAKTEFRLTGDVVDYWLDRWRAELEPNEQDLADGVAAIERRLSSAGDSVFRLYDSGRRREAYVMAQLELKERLQPALERVNRDIYRKARENSVQRAFVRVEQIVDAERRLLLWIVVLTFGVGLLASWFISRRLLHPLGELRRAMAAVGEGDLEHPIRADGRDEIGDLARAFARMTEALRRTQARLVQSEKLASIGEMAAAVAHGLRNPLASLRAAAQVARRHPDSPAATEHLDAIIAEVDRLDRRIAHLLTFARPARGQPVRESVPALIRGLLPAFAEPLREHRVDVALDFAADVPDTRIDPRTIEQALVEIISNALDAMPDGGQLRIAARAHPAPGGAPGVAVVISDTGGGIPAEVLPSVCEPFFTTRPQGTGLGLAIAKRFVEQNGGQLEIASQPGAGTTVRVWLPTEGTVDTRDVA